MLFRSLAAGYEVGSAVEWTWEEVQLVVAWLDTQAHELAKEALQLWGQGRISSAVTTLMKALLMDRDAMASLYMWESMQRGKEAGELLMEDFCLPDGSLMRPPLPFPLPQGFQVGIAMSAIARWLCMMAMVLKGAGLSIVHTFCGYKLTLMEEFCLLGGSLTPLPLPYPLPVGFKVGIASAGHFVG